MRGPPSMLRCAMDLCYPIQSYRGWVSNCSINVGDVDHECSKVGFRILFIFQLQVPVSTIISLTLAFICSDAWQFTSWQQECMPRCFPCMESKQTRPARSFKWAESSKNWFKHSQKNDFLDANYIRTFNQIKRKETNSFDYDVLSRRNFIDAVWFSSDDVSRS